MLLLSIVYVALCLLVAYLGRERKFGFWGYLAAALVLDPIIGIIIVLASDKKKPAAAELPPPATAVSA
jgi:uncharacterized membrane protein YhdT